MTQAENHSGATNRGGGHGASPVFLVALAAIDMALLALALLLGAGEVRDGAGSVTTGYTLAWGIAITLTATIALLWVPLPLQLRRATQAFALLAMAAHALGHLARFYYDYWWYDDLLHFGLLIPASLLGLRHAQALNFFPPRHATPARAALLTLLLATALAGVWEIFEFTMDQLQGSREQDDLADTMKDMIDGVFGGLVAAAWSFRHPRGRSHRA